MDEHGVKSSQTTPEKLRGVGCDREPFTPEHAECICRLANEVADAMERMRSCFDAMQRAIEREGYDVLINIEGTEVSLRPRDHDAGFLEAANTALDNFNK